MINLNFFPEFLRQNLIMQPMLTSDSYLLLQLPQCLSIYISQLYRLTLFLYKCCVTEILPLTLIEGFNMFMTYIYIYTYMIKTGVFFKSLVSYYQSIFGSIIQVQIQLMDVLFFPKFGNHCIFPYSVSQRRASKMLARNEQCLFFLKWQLCVQVFNCISFWCSK